MTIDTEPTSGQSEESTNPETDRVRPKPKKEKKKKASRSVETLFRTTLTNHLKLSEMADQKASLMISINAIVVSIIVSSFFGKPDNLSTYLLMPTVVLLFVCLVTIVLALIATNPVIKSKPTAAPTTDEPETDLLFFGDYIKLSPDDYRHNLRQLLTNDELLHTALIDNVYAQGRVLDRKYRLLKFTYRFFMLGFSAAVVSYVVALFFFR